MNVPSPRFPSGRSRLCLTRRAAGLIVLLALHPATVSARDGAAVPSFTPSEEAFIVFAGAGFRLPLEDAIERFRERTGLSVEASFAGSGCLLAQAELLGRGDVFIPGEEVYLEQARARGLVDRTVKLAYLQPVVAVARGNPERIHSLSDLARPGLRVGLGDGQSVAIGLAAERWIDATLNAGQAAGLRANVRTRAINVNELGSQLALDALDAVVVWDVTLPLFPALERAPVSGGREHRTLIVGGALRFSRHPEEASAFLTYLSSDEGRMIFQRWGYEPWAAGDGSTGAAVRTP